MKIETKYNIGQEVWLVDDGHPTTAQVEAFDYAYGIGVVYLVRLLEAELLLCV